jgi:hypothetical protein
LLLDCVDEDVSMALELQPEVSMTIPLLLEHDFVVIGHQEYLKDTSIEQ